MRDSRRIGLWLKKNPAPSAGQDLLKIFCVMRDRQTAGQLLLIRLTTLPSVKTLSPVCSCRFHHDLILRSPPSVTFSHLSILPLDTLSGAHHGRGRAIRLPRSSPQSRRWPVRIERNIAGCPAFGALDLIDRLAIFLLPWRTLSPWREDTPCERCEHGLRNIFLLYFLLRTRNGERGQEKDRESVETRARLMVDYSFKVYEWQSGSGNSWHNENPLMPNEQQL